MEKIIFLDRDGVINRDRVEYTRSWAEFEFLPNVLVALRRLTAMGFKIIITSNQAGVGKGLYTQATLADITRRMIERIEENGGRIYAVHYCRHRDIDNCICRKPKLGLFKQAVINMAVNLKETFVVGDSQRDIQAGNELGCKTILVLCGKTKTAEDVADFKFRPDYVARDLLDAVESVIAKNIIQGA